MGNGVGHFKRYRKEELENSPILLTNFFDFSQKKKGTEIEEGNDIYYLCFFLPDKYMEDGVLFRFIDA